jgi:hypothetical protein
MGCGPLEQPGEREARPQVVVRELRLQRHLDRSGQRHYCG